MNTGKCIMKIKGTTDKFLSDNDISEESYQIVMRKWLSDNPDAAGAPSIKDIEKYFNVNKEISFDKDIYDKALTFYNSKTNNGVIVENNLADLQQMKKDLYAVFGKDNVVSYVNTKGDSVFRVAKPVQKDTPVNMFLQRYGAAVKTTVPKTEESGTQEGQEVKEESPYEKAQGIMSGMIRYAKDNILYDKDLHKFYFYGTDADGNRVKNIIDKSVTGLTGSSEMQSTGDEERDAVIKDSLQASTLTFGNMNDEFLRDYFSGDDGIERNDGISAVTRERMLKVFNEKTVNQMEEDAKFLRESFDNFFKGKKYRLYTDDFPIVSKMVDSVGKVHYVMGKTDMLAIDEDGGVYIFDFKTSRTMRPEMNANLSTDNQAKYHDQISMYKYILKAEHPELDVKNGNVIVTATNYGRSVYMSEDGKVPSGYLYTKNEDGSVDYVNVNDPDDAGKTNDENSPVSMHLDRKSLFKMLPEDMEDSLALRNRKFYGIDYDVTKEADSLKKFKRSQEDIQFEFLHAQKVVPASKLKFLADNTMQTIAYALTEIQKGRAVSDESDNSYFDLANILLSYSEKNSLKDFSMEDIIKSIGGLDNIFNIARSYFFDNEDLEDEKNSTDPEEREHYEMMSAINNLVNNNWNSFVLTGGNMFANLIGYSPSIKMIDMKDKNKVIVDNVDPKTEEEYDRTREENETEAWMLQWENTSAVKSLSQLVRTQMALLPMYMKITGLETSNEALLGHLGHKIDGTFNRTLFINPTAATNAILVWCKDATTVDDMQKILEYYAPENPWLYALIGKEDDGVPGVLNTYPFRQQFFQNFRREFVPYYTVDTKKNKDGSSIVYKKQLNITHNEYNMLNNIKGSFNTGNELNGADASAIFTPDKNSINGIGTVNIDNLNGLKVQLEAFDNAMRRTYTDNKMNYSRGGSMYKYFITDLVKSNKVSTLSTAFRELGIPIDTNVLVSALTADTRYLNKAYDETRAGEMMKHAMYIVDNMLKNGTKEVDGEKKAVPYAPFGISDESMDKGLYSDYKAIVHNLSIFELSSVEPSFYNDGKMYYSMQTPSYVGKFMSKMKQAINGNTDESFDDFITREFGNYAFFCKNPNALHNRKSWLNPWLKLMMTSEAARSNFDHKVQLSYNGTPYVDLGDLGLQMAMMQEFFSGPAVVSPSMASYSWYRMPIMSNKPTFEFMKFRRFTEKQITGKSGDLGMDNIVSQEILRMRTVIQRAAEGISEVSSKIDKYDINLNDSIFKDNEILKKKLSGTLSEEEMKKEATRLKREYNKYYDDDEIQFKGNELSLDDLVKLSKWGSGFHFTYFMNDVLSRVNNESDKSVISDDELTVADGILRKVNGEKLSVGEEGMFRKALSNVIEGEMENIFSSESDKWRTMGIYDKDYTISNGVITDIRSKYLDNVVGEYNKIGENLHKFRVANGIPEKNIGNFLNDHPDLKRLYNDEVQNERNTLDGWIDDSLRNYLYNDMFATMNIIQLTATDLAYYGGSVDFQKRYAEVHSPGLRLDVNAVVTKEMNLPDNMLGKKLSDGTERSMLIADEMILPEIADNVDTALKQMYDKTPDDKKPQFKEYADKLMSIYRETYNSSDAQAYSTPTAYMKKLAMAGKLTPEWSEAYRRVISGNYDVHDLNVISQPLKPFVYSYSNRFSGVSAMSSIKLNTQQKNSEYMLFLADAIMKGGKKTNKLQAIYDFMEDSANDGRTLDDDGNLTNQGTYNGRGIDTVQFVSTSKIGTTKTNSSVKAEDYGVVDLNNAETYADVYNTLYNAAYDENGNYNNNTFVTEIPFEDYCIQQEVPAHMQDSEQSIGSQIMVLSTSDISDDAMFDVNGTKLSKKELIGKYMNLFARNIKDSLNDISEEFKLKGTQVERNQAIHDILQREMNKDSKYDTDLKYACTLDDNGNFVLPLNDPIQSVRIMQLLNSIIKRKVNKQKFAGGPVVQVTSVGLSNTLHIRFKDASGKILDTREEYESKHKGGDFSEYLRKNQNSMAYWETYLTCPSQDLEDWLVNKSYEAVVSGHKDEEGNKVTDYRYYFNNLDAAVKDGIIPESILQAIGYRIPTEDKYSMAPMMIKGFLPRYAGEAVMMPKEVTLLTNSDFDIDKMYMMFKSHHLVDSKGFEGTVDDDVSWKEYNEADKLPYAAREGRNNAIFDLQWSVFTNSDTLSKQLNPGSFDVQKASARRINILKGQSDGSIDTNYTWDQLKDMSLDQLDDIISKTARPNIILPSSQVYYHAQNMTGKKLTGVFANHNISHAMVDTFNYLHPNNPIKLYLGEDVVFNFDGHTQLGSGTGVPFDSQEGMDGTKISKLIASYLGAAVDTAKDPVLSDLNMSTFTVGPAMVLARLGFGCDAIGLILNQPAVLAASLEYFKRSNESGYTTQSSVLNDIKKSIADNYRLCIDEHYGNATQSSIANSLKETFRSNTFTKDDMAKYVGRTLATERLNEASPYDQQFAKYQLESLELLDRLFQISPDLNALTFATKFNSISNAAGPTIADTLVERQKVQSFFDKVSAGRSVFSDNTANIISDMPILNGFYEGTVGLDSVTHDLFSNFFIEETPEFSSLIKRLGHNMHTNPNSKLINQFIKEYMLYSMTSKYSGMDENGNYKPVFDFSPERRRYLAFQENNGFVKKFSDYKNKYNSPLLDVMSINPNNARFNHPMIEASASGLDADTTDMVKNSWSDLVNSDDKEKKQLGLDLLDYSIMRTGFGFSPKSPTHVASVDVKRAKEGYTDALNNKEYIIDTGTFYIQFLRNHTNNRMIVPELHKSDTLHTEVKERPLSDGNKENVITFTSNTPDALSDIIVSNDMIHDITDNFANVIVYDGKTYLLLDAPSMNEVSYKESTPLGVQNNFLEYNAEEEYDMDSIFTKAPVEEVPESDDEITDDKINAAQATLEHMVDEASKSNSNIVDEYKHAFPSNLEALPVGEFKKRFKSLVDDLKNSDAFKALNSEEKSKFADSISLIEKIIC